MTETKNCPGCGLEKLRSEFPKNKAKRNGINSWCKLCSATKSEVWRQVPGNSQRHTQALYKRRKANKGKLIAHYGDKCADCGVSFPEWMYEFHHLDPSQKDTSWAKIKTNSWANIEKEIIGKCVMVCPNCHKWRHYRTDPTMVSDET